MNASNCHDDRTYLRVLANICLLLCASCSVYFLGMDLDAWHGGGVVTPAFLIQAPFFLGTVIALAFFAWPRAAITD